MCVTVIFRVAYFRRGNLLNTYYCFFFQIAIYALQIPRTDEGLVRMLTFLISANPLTGYFIFTFYQFVQRRRRIMGYRPNTARRCTEHDAPLTLPIACFLNFLNMIKSLPFPPSKKNNKIYAFRDDVSVLRYVNRAV